MFKTHLNLKFFVENLFSQKFFKIIIIKNKNNIINQTKNEQFNLL